jgi:hypothetical protein
VKERIEEIEGLRAEISEIRTDLKRLRGQYHRHLTMAVGLVAVLGLIPSWGFARDKKKWVIRDNDTGQAVQISADGIHFTQDDQSRVRIQVGADWADMTMWGATGKAAWNLHSDSESTASKIFSQSEALRVEVSDNLLDSGAGLRLYDSVGKPRATMYAGKWGGKSGFQVTNDIRQPRLDLYAVDKAESVVRLNDDAAASSSEISVLPMDEAMYRYTGMVPQGGQQKGPLVPVLYLSDSRQDVVYLSTLSDR